MLTEANESERLRLQFLKEWLMFACHVYEFVGYNQYKFNVLLRVKFFLIAKTALSKM